MSFKQWVLDLFEDERGHVSIKPVIAMLGTLFLCGTMVTTACVDGESSIPTSLVDAVMVITAIGMGADTLDKFSLRKKSETNQQDISE